MADDSREITINAIDEIHRSSEVNEVVLSLTSFVNYFGFESLSIAQLISPARGGSNKIEITDWPEGLQQQRLQRGTITRDPIALEALRSKTPFTWSDAYCRTNKEGRKFIDETREVTSADGLLIPVHPYNSIPGCLSLGADHIELTREELSCIDVVSVQAFMKLVEILGPFPFEINVNLSGREIDVIHYAAAGKTNWEISKILNISEHTVRAYLQSAAAKLGTISKTHTVAVAIANRLVLT